MSDDIRELFRELADNDDDYAQEGGTILFRRHGVEHSVRVQHIATLGPAVQRPSPQNDWIPVKSYIQSEILKLPILASQIARALEKKHQLQKIKAFIDGPAQVAQYGANRDESSAKASLKDLLQHSEYACTQLIELMAPAGQGKTVLLEHLAVEAAVSYQPIPDPVSLLLVVDLLGRYVGTIHDAIAGSLSNTYQFPGLTGRDVEFCLRQRWLSLALDGFDELVARVGTREAFLRVKELVDDLRDAGTVILSARDSFFNLFEIDSSIRTHLQPKRGSYAISEISLKPWNANQVEQLLSLFGSPDSQSDLKDLLEVFGAEDSIIYRPFFAARLASAWVDGVRFDDVSGIFGQLDRWNYVIRIFLEREVTDKWRNRTDGSPLLSLDGHVIMLGSVAEEMWRSGAFALTKDEVEIAGKIGLAELGLTPTEIDDLATRLPTHGILAVQNGRSIKFLQDSFLHYLLGLRLASNITRHDGESVLAILNKAELPPMVIEWVNWKIDNAGLLTTTAISWLASLVNSLKEAGVAPINLGLIVGGAARRQRLDRLELRGAQFIGEAMRAVKISNTKFVDCTFWVADFGGACLQGCTFEHCQFENVRFDENTDLRASTIKADCTFGNIEINGESGLFDPMEVVAELGKRGATIEAAVVPAINVQNRRSVSSDAIHCIDKFRRAKTWDIVLDDFDERYGPIVWRIADLAVQAEVMRQSKRDSKGSRKTFCRFTVDRERLFSGQLGPTGEPAIDRFWELLEREMPER